MKTTTFGCLLKSVSAIMLFTLSQAAIAGPILSPVSVYNNTIGTFDGVNGLPVQMINQSGLSAGFTSGVTDFDAYMAGNPTHARLDSEGFVGPLDGPFTGILDFDLGATHTVENFALWNNALGSEANIDSFTLFLSSFSDFSVASNLGTFNNLPMPASDPYPASVFDTVDASGRYLRLQVNTYFGARVVEIGEIAVEVAAAATPVPEPGSLALLSLALAGFTASRRRVHK